MIRRDPNHRPPPAWPPNPPAPQRDRAPPTPPPPPYRPPNPAVRQPPPPTGRRRRDEAEAPPASRRPRARSWCSCSARRRCSSAPDSGSTPSCTGSRCCPTTPTGPPRARAPRGCWSARTAGRDCRRNNRTNSPPAATWAPAGPTPSCWCTSRRSAPSTPTTMVSIPRDSYVEIPDHGEDKINAAFVDRRRPAAGPDRRAGNGHPARPLRRDRVRRVRASWSTPSAA